MKPFALQNASDIGGQKPTIQITTNDPDWADAHASWLKGKNPTDSPEWGKGVFLILKEISNG